MDISIKFENLQFHKIKSPKEDLLEALGQLGLEYAFPPLVSNMPLLSENAQRLLLHAHPLILWRKEVVSGLRTYWMLGNFPKEAVVRVGLLSSRLSRNDVIEFARYSELLSCIHSSVFSPIGSIYAAALNNLDNDCLPTLCPLFGGSQRRAARELKTTPKTLSDAIKALNERFNTD